MHISFTVNLLTLIANLLYVLICFNCMFMKVEVQFSPKLLREMLTFPYPYSKSSHHLIHSDWLLASVAALGLDVVFPISNTTQ